MKKILLITILLITFMLSAFSQVNFDFGYILDKEATYENKSHDVANEGDLLFFARQNITLDQKNFYVNFVPTAILLYSTNDNIFSFYGANLNVSIGWKINNNIELCAEYDGFYHDDTWYYDTNVEKVFNSEALAYIRIKM